MLHALLVVAGWANVFVMTTPLDDEERAVILADAYGFGIPRSVALANEAAAGAHHRLMSHDLWGRLTESDYADWSNDMTRRRWAWASLADALNERLPLCDRLECLMDLRREIGPENFDARWMPPSVPSYRR